MATREEPEKLIEELEKLEKRIAKLAKRMGEFPETALADKLANAIERREKCMAEIERRGLEKLYKEGGESEPYEIEQFWASVGACKFEEGRIKLCKKGEDEANGK